MGEYDGGGTGMAIYLSFLPYFLPSFYLLENSWQLAR